MMIIKELYISAFGKLENESFKFNSGLNSIIRENGYGKTTLTMFIKAMLYGLEGNTKRSLSENERKNYLPWSGQAAGGYINISYAGTDYRIERTFGKRASEDTLSVINLFTGKPDNIFGDCPGEVIFDIDSDGFMRTMFLSERMLSGPINNDSLTGKLSNLTAVEYDIREYENAKTALEDARRFYYKRGGSGEIAEAKRRLSELEEKYRKLDEVRKTRDQLAIEAEGVKNEINKLKTEAEALAQRRTALGAQISANSYKREYASIKSRYEASLSELHEAESVFNGSIPSMNDIIEHRAEASRLEREIDRLQSNVPESCDVSFAIRPEQSDIDKYDELLNNIRNNSNTLAITLFIISIIFISASAVLSIFLRNTLTLTIAVMSFICFVGAAIFVGAKIKRISAMTVQLKDFFAYADKCYGVPLDNDITAEELFDKLTMDMKQLAFYEARCRMKESDISEATRALTLCNSFFAGYNSTAEELIAALTRLEALKKRVNDEAKLLGTFAEEHGISDSTPISENIAYDETDTTLGIKISEHYNELMRLEALLSSYKHRIQACDDALEASAQTEENLADAREHLAYCEERFEVLSGAIKLLSEAKEQMTAKYIGTTKAAFDKYLHLLGEDGDFIMDTEFEVSKTDGGATHERDAYSLGTRELFAFAVRLSLIDSLFGNDTLPIIIDDAFAHYDSRHIMLAAKMLAEIAKSRQIIYLSCHESRDVDKLTKKQ